MKGCYPVPSSIIEAKAQFAIGDASTLSQLTNEEFVARWSAIAYLEPGLHPDGYECEDSGWPEDLKLYAAEAWRRSSCGELSDEAMYCSYAGWARLYDRMNSHTDEEAELREWIARGEF